MNHLPEKPLPVTPPSGQSSPPMNALAKEQMTTREIYNVVSDTATGVNIRKSDNLVQAAFILLTVLAGAGLGATLAEFNDWGLPWFGGALIGAFAGLVLGLFASGIFLMVYRAMRHIKGKHD
ncbi:MAG: hypothetical protein MPJ50_04045 [Pirellulales bacterium]|nr:hypothetical protein [Pirellulales bacterium]